MCVRIGSYKLFLMNQENETPSDHADFIEIYDSKNVDFDDINLEPTNVKTCNYGLNLIGGDTLENEAIQVQHNSYSDEIWDQVKKLNERPNLITNTEDEEVKEETFSSEKENCISQNNIEVDEIKNASDKPGKKIDLKQYPFQKKKTKKILNALKKDDVEMLKKAAISTGGLINDDIRRKVWPKLIGVDIFATSPRPTQEEIEEHPYYRQVVLDVNRSLKRFPPSIKEAQRLALQEQLVLLIMRILFHHPELHYYQGYHDICVTFLLVLGEEMSYYVIEALSLTHFKDFMEKTMEPTISILSYMYPLIGKKNFKLMKFLYISEVGVAYCLSWLITWFGHVLNNYDEVVRLFDFFIVSHAWMPVYLTASIVLHRELEILEQECDMACVHSLLSRVPDDLPFEKLILQSIDLYNTYPPKVLEKRKPGRISSALRAIKIKVPSSKITFSIVIAAAVLVTAVLYQKFIY